MRALLVVVMLLYAASAAVAQTGTPTSWTLTIYQAGGAVVNAVTVQASQVQCNIIPPEMPTTVNPNKWRWNDPVNAGKFCLYDDTARLAALPDGSYEGTAVATNASGSSAETARVPFSRSRPNPPAVPSGLQLLP